MEDSQIAMIVSIFKWSNDLDELGIFGGTTMAYEMLTHGVLLRKKRQDMPMHDFAGKILWQLTIQDFARFWRRNYLPPIEAPVSPPFFLGPPLEPHSHLAPSLSLGIGSQAHRQHSHQIVDQGDPRLGDIHRALLLWLRSLVTSEYGMRRTKICWPSSKPMCCWGNDLNSWRKISIYIWCNIKI